MSASTSKSGGLSFGKERDRKSTLTTISPEPASDGEQEIEDGGAVEDPCLVNEKMERRLVRKIDLRLCTIAGVLCSLNLLDRFVYPLIGGRSADWVAVGLLVRRALLVFLRILVWGLGIVM